MEVYLVMIPIYLLLYILFGRDKKKDDDEKK